MPFQIIRDDITKVRADAIVNTANPEPVYAAGTDAAIYKAAGADRLLAERKKIGRISPGEAAVTSAFKLKAKFIIHTVGPVWQDGNHDEYALLASCYRKSLLIARQLGCKSIAFPLISTGVYGFPKDKALDIALREISDFLEDAEMKVTLVVFDRKAFDLSAGLVAGISQYIDENYVDTQSAEEYSGPDSYSEDYFGQMSRRDRDARTGRGLRDKLLRRRPRRRNTPGPEDSDLSGSGCQQYLMDASVSYESGTDKHDFSSAPAPEAPEISETGAGFLFPAENLPEENTPPISDDTENMPAAGFPTESFPDTGFPVESAPTESFPAESTPTESFPDTGFPAESFPAPRAARASRPSKSSAPPSQSASGYPQRSLKDVMAHVGENFHDCLLRLIDERGFTDTQVYKRANIDRKLFSKIRCKPDYTPSRKTAISLAVALELNMDEMTDLLRKAGIALSPGSKFDLIIRYCVENGIYDTMRINAILFDYDQPLLGA